jgi:hypothetical protein
MPEFKFYIFKNRLKVIKCFKILSCYMKDKNISLEMNVYIDLFRFIK